MEKKLNQLIRSVIAENRTMDELADLIQDYIIGEEISLTIQERIKEAMEDILEESQTIDEFSRRAKKMILRHIDSDRPQMKYSRPSEDQEYDFDLEDYE